MTSAETATQIHPPSDKFKEHDPSMPEAEKFLNGEASEGQAETQFVTEKKARKTQQRRKYLDLILLAVAGTCVMTAFNGLGSLQSSLNTEGGLGFLTLCAIWVGAILSCLYAPILVEKFTPKRTLMLAQCCHIVFVSSNFYPKVYTLLPAGMLLGLALGAQWTATGFYITTLALDHAEIAQKPIEFSISRFNGLHWLLFKSSHVWGNIIAFSVLQHSSHATPATNDTTYNNDTTPIAYRLNASCGLLSCPETIETLHTHAETKTHRPEDYLVYILLGSYVGLIFVGLVITTFIIPEVSPHAHGNESKKDTLETLLGTFMLLKDYRMSLLVPLCMFSGLHQAFLFGDFTKAYITCELGIEWVGYTMICYGVSSSVGPYIFGHLLKWTGFNALYLSAFVVNVALFIQMLAWPIPPEHIAYFFLVPTIWGFLNGVWMSVTLALFGVRFPSNQRPAFANFNLWQNIAFATAYGYSSHLCIASKIYVCLGTLVMAAMLYVVVEIKTRSSKSIEEEMAAPSSNGHLPSSNGRLSEVERLHSREFHSREFQSNLSVTFRQNGGPKRASNTMLHVTDYAFLAASTGSLVAEMDALSSSHKDSRLNLR
ncbi:protein unc-93 homolog A [Lingula anatina]|uniref:Protein unc-93 homolog A n=1 Tax=Lingula anatina TaxID=7574 RepID=A0A1S3JTL4_LINAN|nr:protein unc-93 homolog A [Lingula anatina]XP_013413709.1 protein unc-93 homolog A [Lingula anatina]XP_013413710.1 protein unc-93 homolog A [Lingula anatina]|eukprot:XP_013413708.1 protein unc-93 homolog A [Lingula anatina]